MKSSADTLRSSLSQLQRAVAKCYSQLRQRFEGNSLISTLWALMDHDLQAQVESLKKLPPSFWQSLKKQEKELARAAEGILHQDAGDKTGSLSLCLAQTLALEEPIILKVYAPIIRRLRTEWTDLALDFYVMVRAHITRLAQSVQLYSGDPALSLRCEVLLHGFEREVQDQVEVRGLQARSTPKKPGAKRAGKVAGGRHTQAPAAARQARPRRKIAERAERLVPKIEITRRRVRR